MPITVPSLGASSEPNAIQRAERSKVAMRRDLAMAVSLADSRFPKSPTRRIWKRRILRVSPQLVANHRSGNGKTLTLGQSCEGGNCETHNRGAIEGSTSTCRQMEASVACQLNVIDALLAANGTRQIQSLNQSGGERKQQQFVHQWQKRYGPPFSKFIIMLFYK